MDTITPEHRSWNMSRIRSKDTKPEKVVRSFLHRNGFRFRLHVKTLPGHPDIVLPKYKTVIEIRGCFWHRHKGCKISTMPSTNVDFWRKKFRRNMERDRKNISDLKLLGWNVIVIWGCETKNDKFPPENLADFINNAENRSLMNSKEESRETGENGRLIQRKKVPSCRSSRQKSNREGQNG